MSGFSCVVASDIKVYAAFSSILHMSFFFFIICMQSSLSGASAFYILLGHGFVSSI